jgi:hypothetical protein
MRRTGLVGHASKRESKHAPLAEMNLADELKPEFENAPMGECRCCKAQNVPVLTLHNTSNDAETITLCFKCMTGQTPFKPQGPQAN